MDVGMTPFFGACWVRVPGGVSEGEKMKKVSPGISPSIREYARRINKTADLNCEQVGHALVFECEMNAWIDRLEVEERERKEEGRNGRNSRNSY